MEFQATGQTEEEEEERAEEEKKRDGEHVVPVLRVHRSSERRDHGEMGPFREIGGARFQFLQPFPGSMDRRSSLHPPQLSRCPRRDQDQGTPISILISSQQSSNLFVFLANKEQPHSIIIIRLL